jgi:hypothetical protein
VAKGLVAVRVHGNFKGPGQSCLLLLSEGQLVGQLGCVGGPDAGVAFGTAGLQGAAVVGGATLLGTSFPGNKGTSVSSTGGAGTGGSSNASGAGGSSTATGGAGGNSTSSSDSTATGGTGGTGGNPSAGASSTQYNVTPLTQKAPGK